MCVLGADHRGALRKAHLRHFAQGDGATASRQWDQHFAGDGLGIVAGVARIADGDVVALASFDRGGNRASPWQNGFAERLIGSIRRECVDHLIVLSEAHLRQILRAYARYYNDIRTHWSLAKNSPISRAIQPTGSIRSNAILGGLHHHYVRV